ncbi:MAG: flagellar basal body rod protein FlgB [SAR324 cluster bacterium]|nr:flagellar basal body rod protein FlgB [SAR324 cluster bacterium]MBF0349832.1 flagellar basal body rod protein FlgB [SAR324 cluster bacterium]
MAGIFHTKTMTLLEKSMHFRTQRHDLLVSNIANKDTEGYQAQDMVFERNLKTALKADMPGPLNTLDPRHFDGNNTPPIETVEGTRINSASSTVGFNGNTVDLDKEMAKLAENQLMYNATSRMIAFQIRQMRTSIMEGR